MQLQAVSQDVSRIATDWLIVPVVESGEQSPAFESLDAALGGRLSRLRESGDWTGKACEALELREPVAGGPSRLLLIGTGQPDKLTRAAAHRALMTAVRRITVKQATHIAVVPPSGPSLDPLAAIEIPALSLVIGSTGQGLYRAEQSRFSPPHGAVVVPPGVDAATAVVARGGVIGDAVNLARELVNRHPGELYPETFAQRASQIAAQYGLNCHILDERQIADERMGCLLGVARGSERPPRVVMLEYRGAPATTETIGWIGKGVTFDSGGLTLKTIDGMKTMKCDMAGAAAVLAAMTAVAQLKLPVNILGAIGLVENMTGGNAYKLGEVLTSRAGVTVEVMNTDAEGRLVLADVLSYAIDQGASKLVDLATLTGSCVIALGEDIAGVFANDQPWCDQVLTAAQVAGEHVWQMPMFDSFCEQLKSDVADCKNVGARWGGSITAAKFLEKFVAGKPWVHLDIAGPAFVESSKPHIEGGGTGTMVRTLVELAQGR